MKNSALVTISTIHRTWVLSLGKATRIFLAFTAILIICSMVLGGFVLHKFSDNIDYLEAKKEQLEHNIITLNSSAEILEQKIQTQEFTLVKLQELEELAGTEMEDVSADSFVFSGEQIALSKEKENQILERISNAKVSLAERRWLLNTIPNGKPIVLNTYVTSSFGARVHPITKKNQMHYGIDMHTGIGDDVIATADGVVEYSAFNTGGFGHLVRLRHNYGFTTVYAHLSKRLVKNGEVVTKGQVIAKTGNSGISTGPHIHYEIHFLKKKLNPARFIKWSLDNYKDLFIKEKNVRWTMLLDQVKLHVRGIQSAKSILPTKAPLTSN